MKGFNQAWFKQYYSFQWLDRFYDHDYAENLLKLSSEANSDIFRIWLFEGTNLNQFELDHYGNPVKIKDEVLKNFRDFLQLSQKYHQKVYLTFLDGNSFYGIQNSPKLPFWWNMFNDEFDVQKNFFKIALKPVYELVDQNFKETVTQIDLVNEVNALFYTDIFSSKKEGLSKFLCGAKKGSPVMVTASLGGYNTEELYFSDFLDESCLDFFDLHFYNDSGSIPHCNEFQNQAKNGIRLQLGEFGQLSTTFDDELQSSVTMNFISNAKTCGFESALAWRLEDVREGYNQDARFSYLSFGLTRKAYQTFKQQ
jgi:hypothetical protein